MSGSSNKLRRDGKLISTSRLLRTVYIQITASNGFKQGAIAALPYVLFIKGFCTAEALHLKAKQNGCRISCQRRCSPQLTGEREPSWRQHEASTAAVCP